MDPRAMREWAMAPLAVTLGLTESLRAERPGLPVRKLVQDVMIEKNKMPHQTLYVGRGSFHHKADYDQVEIALDTRPQLRGWRMACTVHCPYPHIAVVGRPA